MTRGLGPSHDPRRLDGGDVQHNPQTRHQETTKANVRELCRTSETGVACQTRPLYSVSKLHQEEPWTPQEARRIEVSWYSATARSKPGDRSGLSPAIVVMGDRVAGLASVRIS